MRFADQPRLALRVRGDLWLRRSPGAALVPRASPGLPGQVRLGWGKGKDIDAVCFPKRLDGLAAFGLAGFWRVWRGGVQWGFWKVGAGLVWGVRGVGWRNGFPVGLYPQSTASPCYQKDILFGVACKSKQQGFSKKGRHASTGWGFHCGSWVP